jgi:hypothetical protein
MISPGRGSGLKRRAQDTKQFARRAGRHECRSLVPRARDQRPQCLRIERRVQGDERLQRRLSFLDQAVAPALEAVKAACRFLLRQLLRRERRRDRRDVARAHELADVLLLAGNRAVRAQAAREHDRIAQPLRQWQRIEFRGGQRDQLNPEALKRQSVALALALARRRLARLAALLRRLLIGAAAWHGNSRPGPRPPEA